MRLLAALCALSLVGFAGCNAPANDPVASGPDPAAPSTFLVFSGQQAWPTVPVETTGLSFAVPDNATELAISFNWRGQQPGGYSSNRAAVAIDPQGQETELLGGDLPANPYLCASSTCGPAEARVEHFDGALAGTWVVELRGTYTATAYVDAFVTAPSA